MKNFGTTRVLIKMCSMKIFTVLDVCKIFSNIVQKCKNLDSDVTYTEAQKSRIISIQIKEIFQKKRTHNFFWLRNF